MKTKEFSQTILIIIVLQFFGPISTVSAQYYRFDRNISGKLIEKNESLSEHMKKELILGLGFVDLWLKKSGPDSMEMAMKTIVPLYKKLHIDEFNDTLILDKNFIKHNFFVFAKTDSALDSINFHQTVQEDKLYVQRLLEEDNKLNQSVSFETLILSVKAKKEEIVHGSFKFQNKSQDELSLHDISGNPNCEISYYPKYRIISGDSDSINFILHTSDLKIGLNLVTIKVHHNLSVEPMELTVICNVEE